MLVTVVLGTSALYSAAALSVEANEKNLLRREVKLGELDAAALSVEAKREPLNATETRFLNDVLLSWGKQRPDYKGVSKNVGFKNLFFRDDGMFDFDPSIKSVAIDVGAANNPLPFDTDRDMSQIVFLLEPGFYKLLEREFEDDAKKRKSNGGCIPHKRWDPWCTQERMYVFPAAAAPQIGHATFRTPSNPYCASLNNLDDSAAADMKAAKGELGSVFKGCWGDLPNAALTKVPTITLASIIRRIPTHIAIKYVKIDAQGLDFKILKSAEDQLPRIGYVRFEMQVDPPEGRKMVSDIPKYDDVVAFMKSNGFQYDGDSACGEFDGKSEFSEAIHEKECIFCQHPPCKEKDVPPMGDNPNIGASS